jgi:prepilin-type N-terminal cleavage/methylation domain-containing protein
MSALRRRRTPGEGGFTLIEALVVMVVMGIVGSLVTVSLVRGLHTTSSAQRRIQALADLQRGVERMARELRVADPLCLTDGQEATRLGASVYREGKRYRYEYYLVESAGEQQILEDVTVFDPPDATTGSLVRSGTFVAEVANAELGMALFEYFDQDGEAPAAYANAAQVRINLTKSLSDADPVVVTTSVEVRNTRYSGGDSTC